MTAVTIWSWDDAPEEYRVLSPHGGDEDFVTHVPAEIVENVTTEIDEHYGTTEVRVSLADGWSRLDYAIERLGVCHTSYHQLDDGSVVAIAAHS